MAYTAESYIYYYINGIVFVSNISKQNILIAKIIAQKKTCAYVVQWKNEMTVDACMEHCERI